MTNLLLISEDPGAPSLLARLAGREAIRVTFRRNPEEAAGALSAGVFDLCVVHAENFDGAAIGRLGALRQVSDSIPVLALAGTTTPAIELAAPYSAGADIVATLPVEPAAFVAMIARLTRPGRPQIPVLPELLPPAPPPLATGPAFGAPALGVLRDFSRVLGYSLDERQLVTHFLQKLREIVGVNRITVFVEPPAPGTPSFARTPRSPRLVAAGSIGVPLDVVECFELSLKHGIGRRVSTSGQVLRAQPNGALAGVEDPRIAREFEVLGGQLAIPISDRERCVGVGIVGGKLTGERFTGEELELLCHLLEELGLALKNSRLHAQVTASHRLFSDVLEANTSGLLVVGPDLELLHANRAAREFLGKPRESAANAPLVFADLPPKLATAVHEFVQQGKTPAPFVTELPGRGAQVFRVSLLPFAREARPLPQPVLAVVEDFSAIEAAKRAEIESANLKLTATIARRFAHEIRNSLVPLTTHQQLFDAEYASEEFRQSLKNALTVETSRIQRFTEQMLFLSHAQNPPADIGPAEALLREAFAQAQTILNKTAQLDLVGPKEAPLVRFHRPSLLHAFKEIFLNAIQSAGPNAVIRVRLTVSENESDHRLQISFRDSGPGFNATTLARATEPFYTTRNTGVGLGLTVARKVVEDHRGALELFDRATSPNAAGDVVLTFPQDF